VINWKDFWDEKARHADPHQQVGRSLNEAAPEARLDAIADDIARKLSLQETDTLLDVCCGNGVLTRHLASRCRHVTGVDLSPVQVGNARSDQPANVTFREGNAMRLEASVREAFDKILCYFSFQYFDTYQKGRRVVHAMNERLRPDGCILLGDVPDAARRWQYYTSYWSRFRHFLARMRGTNRMGKFWHREELARICDEIEADGTLLSQPDSFLHAHYRFDYLIQKKPAA